MKRVNFYIDESQDLLLRRVSQEGLTISEHIRRAIDEYLEKMKPYLTRPASSPKKGDKNARK